MKSIKRNLLKLTAAAALTITGVATTHHVKPAQQVQAATQVVKVNYVPGYGIAVWSNYNNGTPTGQYLAHGTSWKVLKTATDSKGATWYDLGANQWVEAKYTVAAGQPVSGAPATKTASSQVSSIVSLASAQLGKSYVWGGNGNPGFDCSGLVNYVYSNAGVNLGRTTYTQVTHGTTVSMNSLQPGDLLFWGSASAPYHVGIYIGNNQYIHAANPGQGVIKQTISSYFYPSVAKRVL